MTKGPRRPDTRFSASPDPHLDRTPFERPSALSQDGMYDACVASLAREVISRLADRARADDEVEPGM